MTIKKSKGPSGTFRENKIAGIHKWYPYIEGYSYNFIENEINLLEKKPNTIYDPFGGSGTTPLVASQMGIKSFYSETNPAMQFIADTKINVTKKSYANWEKVKVELISLEVELEKILPATSIITDINYDGFEKYYSQKALTELLIIKESISEICNTEEARSLAKLALISILVFVSKMVRRSDLRYAKDHEKSEVNEDIKGSYIDKLNEVIDDITNYGNTIKKETIMIKDDVRKATFDNKVDAVITSPPYLNGTNYIRNTKLELKMLDCIITEKNLPLLHSKGIIAGINSVSKRNTTPKVLDIVESYVNELNSVAYDSRIPLMVSGYFYDMKQVIKKLSESIKVDGDFILDIGDSQFAGVHIPTHELLSIIAEENGFKKYEEDILRARRSNNGMKLTQRVLRFKKHK